MPLVGTSTHFKRISYRPPVIRTVFVGESPPANGAFFYCGNSNLARYTREGLASLGASQVDIQQFLEEFRDWGFYLIDLCEAPINHLKGRERCAARRAGERDLAGSLEQTDAEAVVVVMKGILPSVHRAIRSNGLEVPVHSLPFPAHGHQRQYVEQLRNLAPSLPRNEV